MQRPSERRDSPAHGGLRISPAQPSDPKTLPASFGYSNERLLVTWTKHETGSARRMADRVHRSWLDAKREAPAAGAPNDEYWGFVDREGNVVVDLIYYDANFYCDGLAAVSAGPRTAPRWGMIDLDGEVVVPFKYDWLGCMSEGLIPFADGQRFGYMDRQQKVVISPRFGGAFPFYDGRAAVTLEWLYANVVDRRARWINRRGKVISSRKVVAPVNFDYLRRRAEAESPLSRYKTQDQWGYRNRMGDVVTPAQYDRAELFSGGLASVDTVFGDGTSEYINLAGEVVFSVPYDSTAPVADGRIVRVAFPDNGTLDVDDDPPFYWGVYDTAGKLVFDEIKGFQTPPRHVELSDDDAAPRGGASP